MARLILVLPSGLHLSGAERPVADIGGQVGPEAARGQGQVRPGLHAAHGAVGRAVSGVDRGEVPGDDPRRPVVPSMRTITPIPASASMTAATHQPPEALVAR